MRLIDADRLKQYFDIVGVNDYGCSFATIDSQPTVDAEPVRRGKWVEIGSGFNYHFECSECGWKDGYPFNERHKYCPNCGAKMEKCENE